MDYLVIIYRQYYSGLDKNFKSCTTNGFHIYFNNENCMKTFPVKIKLFVLFNIIRIPTYFFGHRFMAS